MALKLSFEELCKMGLVGRKVVCRIGRREYRFWVGDQRVSKRVGLVLECDPRRKTPEADRRVGKRRFRLLEPHKRHGAFFVHGDFVIERRGNLIVCVPPARKRGSRKKARHVVVIVLRD